MRYICISFRRSLLLEIIDFQSWRQLKICIQPLGFGLSSSRFEPLLDEGLRQLDLVSLLLDRTGCLRQFIHELKRGDAERTVNMLS